MSVIRASRSEWIKFSRLRLLYFGLLAVGLLCILLGITCWVALRKYGFETNGYGILAITVKAGTQLSSFFIIALSALAFSGEVNLRTFNILLTQPVRRSEIFLSKLVVLFAGVILFELVIWLCGLLSALLNTGFGDIVVSGYTVLTCSEAFKSALISFLILFPPLLSFVAIGVFVSVLVENAGASVTVGVAILLFLELSGLFPGMQDIAPYLAGGQVSYAIDYLSSTASGVRATLESLGTSIAISFAYTVVLLVPSLLVFRKKDYAL